MQRTLNTLSSRDKVSHFMSVHEPSLAGAENSDDIPKNARRPSETHCGRDSIALVLRFSEEGMAWLLKLLHRQGVLAHSCMTSSEQGGRASYRN